MKKFNLFIIVFLLMLVLALGACKKSGLARDGGEGISAPDSFIYSKAYDYYGEGYTGEGEGMEKEDQGFENIQPGQLTVCAYDDNDNWDFYLKLIGEKNEVGQEGEEDPSKGLFNGFQGKYNLPQNRVALKVENNVNAKFTLLDNDGNEEFSAYSDNFGNVYLFNNEKREKYNVKVTTYRNNQKEETFIEVEDGDKIDLGLEKENSNIIQLMFVIDTTGSMGDEIRYLKSEVKNVIERIKQDNDGVTIYLALLFYRDQGDQYVTRYFDFSKDIDAQVEKLGKQGAAGGGDFEEAVQAAFEEASKAQWLASSTNILVHIADAPAHDQDVDLWFRSVAKLANQNVKVINVASSGIDKLTEYLFRNECIQTGGYYCYLTNDSGIGGDHIEATVDSAPVIEYLNDCLVRLINGIHSGDMKSPVSYKQAQ